MRAGTIRYDDTKIDRLLIKEYQKQFETDLKDIRGLNDIDAMLKSFERIFAAYIGVERAFAVNSGTDALQLSLLVSGIGKGDSVIVPDVTYPAVPLAVLYAGAEPVIVEVKKSDLQIDEGRLENSIKKNTKAVIAAHMFARACRIDKIIETAARSGISVIEDCCQAESSVYKDRKLGSYAGISCFSFSYYKPLSSCGGGGGMICSGGALKNVEEYTRIWDDVPALLDAGKRFSRMNLLDLSAVKVKFRYLKDIIRSRLRIKRIYENALSGLGGIRYFEDEPDTVSVPQNFLVYCDRRDELGSYLEERGIIWQRPYKPLHSMKIFRKYAQGDFAASREYERCALQLPLYSFMTEEDAARVAMAVREFFN